MIIEMWRSSRERWEDHVRSESSDLRRDSLVNFFYTLDTNNFFFFSLFYITLIFDTKKWPLRSSRRREQGPFNLKLRTHSRPFDISYRWSWHIRFFTFDGSDNFYIHFCFISSNTLGDDLLDLLSVYRWRKKTCFRLFVLMSRFMFIFDSFFLVFRFRFSGWETDDCSFTFNVVFASLLIDPL